MEIAELICGTMDDPGSRNALQIILSHLTQCLKQDADGTSISRSEALPDTFVVCH